MMSGLRKTLHHLQSAANDKENLVGPGRLLPLSREVKDSNKTPISENKPNKQKKTISRGVQAVMDEIAGQNSFLAEDLTSSDGPSEKYWEGIAEQRRVALECTLQENQELQTVNGDLQKRVELLREESKVMREMLEETDTLVEVLKDMINGDGSADESSILSDSL